MTTAVLAAALAMPQAAWAADDQPAAPAAAQPAASEAQPASAPAASAATPAPVPESTAAPVAADASSAPAPAPTASATPPPPVPSHTCEGCVQPRPAPNLPKDDGTGLLIGGACTLGTVYVMSSLSGATMIDKARGQERADNPLTPEDESYDADGKRNAGRALLIPLAGPFMAMRHTESAKGQWGLALGGALQVTGAALIIAGAIRRARYKQARRWGLVANADRDGGTVGMQMRF